MSGELALENQGGDPALPEETLSLQSAQIDELDRITAATGLEVPPQFAEKDASVLFTQQLLATAGAEADVGVSRRSNRPRVTEYLNLLGLDFADDSGTPYPFCAAGVSWATPNPSAILHQRSPIVPKRAFASSVRCCNHCEPTISGQMLVAKRSRTTPRLADYG